MLICREKELNMLSDMYNSSNFRFLIMYGRRGSGKTSILREFARKKDVIYFCPRVVNDYMGLADFSRALKVYFEKDVSVPFTDWESAFSYLSSKVGKKRLVIIIDEFYQLTAENPSFISLLKRTIDHTLRMKNVFLILSDSHVGYIENELLGYSSPFYGSVTGHMAVMPFDYYDASRLFHDYSAIDRIITYGIAGGTPAYLTRFDSSRTPSENAAECIFRKYSFLNDEPQALLHNEFRDLAVYNSILKAVSEGTCRMNDISAATHEESQKCSKYLSTLRNAWLIDKITPIGEDESGKKSVYGHSDNFFRFWYRFSSYEIRITDLRDPDDIARELLASSDFTEYMKDIFRNVCREYMIRKALAGRLPFSPSSVGRWWNGSARNKEHSSLDLLAVDKNREHAIFGKCRFGNEPLDETDLEDLIASSRGFGRVGEAYYYLFSKEGFTERIAAKARKSRNVKLINIEDLFKI